MGARVFNFNAGPSTLPLTVLEEAQRDLINYKNKGLSVMEMSHRAPEFIAIRDHAEQTLRQLMAIPDDYAVLFLQGGATTQFTMIPMNFYHDACPVAFIHTGSWTKKALQELKKIGSATLVASSEATQFDGIPTIDPSSIPPDASYAYLCSNNTIYGTQFSAFPDTGKVPLVADMSSDILSRVIDVSQFNLIFAGAQKNGGPAGVTIVIVKKSWVASHHNSALPTMFNYQNHIDSGSLLNTCPTFSIYMVGLTAQWLLDQGGIAHIEAKNEEKATRLYDYIDTSDFYVNDVKPGSRSRMNVVFRIQGDSKRTTQFHEEAQAQGLIGLKGHRLVGGLRASIYNAMTLDGIDALLSFMDHFKKKHQASLHYESQHS